MSPKSSAAKGTARSFPCPHAQINPSRAAPNAMTRSVPQSSASRLAAMFSILRGSANERARLDQAPLNPKSNTTPSATIHATKPLMGRRSRIRSTPNATHTATAKATM